MPSRPEHSIDELPPWCNVYDGLTDDEIADVESAILERPNLTP
jgi:hypothetical protein